MESLQTPIAQSMALTLIARRPLIVRPIDRGAEIAMQRAVIGDRLDEEDRGEPVRRIDPEQGRSHAVPEIFARRAAIFLRRMRRPIADRAVEANSDRTLPRQPRATTQRAAGPAGRPTGN